jgi:heme oxygenase (mycobilin-producing)
MKPNKPFIINTLVMLASVVLVSSNVRHILADPGSPSKVILINPFEVVPGQEEKCLKYWERAAAFLRTRPGYMSTRLHKALSPQARFLYINVAEWESAAHFKAAVGDPEFKRITETPACKGSPALFEVIRQ